MILCGSCAKAITLTADVKRFKCSKCKNTRFYQTSIPPMFCDVCAATSNGGQCMICGSRLSAVTSEETARDMLDEKFSKDEFFSKIKGVTMVPGRQENLQKLTKGQELYFLHEEDNPIDPNAIKLFADKDRTIELGYVGKEITPDLLDYMYKYGVRFSIFVSEVTGGSGNKSFGCNIRIKLHR